MKVRNAVVASISFILLTGFESSKMNILVDNCANHGTGWDQCICAFDLIEARTGPAFLEVIYLQVTGQKAAYEAAILKLATENPDLMSKVESAQEEAKKQCFN